MNCSFRFDVFALGKVVAIFVPAFERVAEPLPVLFCMTDFFPQFPQKTSLSSMGFPQLLQYFITNDFLSIKTVKFYASDACSYKVISFL